MKKLTKKQVIEKQNVWCANCGQMLEYNTEEFPKLQPTDPVYIKALFDFYDSKGWVAVKPTKNKKKGYVRIDFNNKGKQLELFCCLCPKCK